jgi:hypothetical protein
VNNPFNKEAVMLHDGKAKIGVVHSTDKARAIRKYIDELSAKLGYDVVLVVSSPPLGKEFLGFTSLNVHIEGYVYERYARKFAAVVRSKE